MKLSKFKFKDTKKDNRALIVMGVFLFIFIVIIGTAFMVGDNVAKYQKRAIDEYTYWQDVYPQKMNYRFAHDALFVFSEIADVVYRENGNWDVNNLKGINNQDKELLKEMVEKGYVSIQKHPTEDLFIHNYTKQAQYEWLWNDITKKCRGLIMNSRGDVIANPFEKFFNLEELDAKEQPIPNEPFEVYEKVDGSLGILYWMRDIPMIATRGSFTSEQAQEGTKILLEKYKDSFEKLG